ncbi:hypothetical protein [Yoonia sp. BS5-3]|uniref:Uncharacterized protein n=1 Tax=Yoonia phaeophyticola TaxID=3137369 RepID=A0ABZ2V530_9RHOB
MTRARTAQPNDGVCKACWTVHAPCFGDFYCSHCDGVVYADALNRNLRSMSFADYGKLILGGLLVAAVIIGVAFVFDI